MGNFCIAVNLRNSAVTQYHNYDFDSMTQTRNGPVGTTPTGLSQLNVGTTDNGQNITALAALFALDLGVPNKKRLRYLSLGIECPLGAQVDVVMDEDEDNTETYDVKLALKSNLRRIRCRRRQSGRYIQLVLKNIAGGYFAINSIDATLIVRNANIE